MSSPKQKQQPINPNANKELLMEKVSNSLNLEVERYAKTHTPAEVDIYKRNVEKVKEMYQRRYDAKKIE